MTPNEGDRPSQLTLARYATGELDAATRTEIARWLEEHPEGRAWLAELEAARSDVPAFDAAGVRSRAAIHVPEPANRPFPWRLLAPILVAAAVLLVLLPRIRHPDETAGIRFKGNETLFVHELGSGELGFEVHPDGHTSVSLLSVDGRGRVTVFFPEPGESAALDPGAAEVPLPFTVTLDDAPGPEIFVALFDADPAAAQALVSRTFQAGGAAAVEDLAARDDVDVVVVPRR